MAPVLISPVDGMRTRDTTPAFDWGDVTDLSGVTYEFTITAYDTNVMTKTVPSSSYAIESSEALPESIYHWRIRAIDGAGNVSDWSETRSFTIELVPPTTVNLGTVHAGTPQVADFTQYNVFIIKVTIITLRDVDNVEISIRESIGKPAWVSEPSGMMYSIYATVTTNIAPSDISSAVILFQLPKSWILQNEIDAGTVKLLRTGSYWHTLSTTPVGGDENYSYFDATTSEFSLFVATGEKAIPPVVPPSRLPLLLIILSIIAVVVGGAIAYYLLTPSRQFAVLRRIERAVVRPRKRQIGELEVEPPVRVRRRVGPTDQVALRRLEHIMRERKKKWEGERQKKSVKRKTKPRKMRKKPVNRRVKLKKVKQKKLVKGRKRSKTKS
jgi:PGF-pre-PGF domain-containing protein